MQGQPLRTEYHQFAQVESGQTVQFAGGGDAGKDVLGAKDRGQVPQLPRHLRFDAWIPGSELLIREH